jgi:phospholipid-binding lipoprotein MlaA
MNNLAFWLFFLTISFSGCAASGKRPAPPPNSSSRPKTTDEFASGQKANDPFIRFNRTMFAVNDTLTTYALRPIAHGYAKIVPRPVRNGITNAFDNAQFPVRFVNCVLQGKLQRSAQEAGKFVVNSVAGVGGLMRVSDHVTSLANVPAEDFGLTLGVWGIPAGPYLVVPLLGPSGCRDLVGFAGDYVIYPLNWHTVGIIHHAFISDTINGALSGTRTVNGLPKSVQDYDQMKAASVDPYIAMRDAYISYRAARIKK